LGVGKSLARPTSRYHRTESIVSLERGVCSCTELQIFGNPDNQRKWSSTVFFYWCAEAHACLSSPSPALSLTKPRVSTFRKFSTALAWAGTPLLKPYVTVRIVNSPTIYNKYHRVGHHHHHLVSLTTGPHALPNRVLQRVRSSVLWPARANTMISLAAPRHPLTVPAGWEFLRGAG